MRATRRFPRPHPSLLPHRHRAAFCPPSLGLAVLLGRHSVEGVEAVHGTKRLQSWSRLKRQRPPNRCPLCHLQHRRSHQPRYPRLCPLSHCWHRHLLPLQPPHPSSVAQLTRIRCGDLARALLKLRNRWRPPCCLRRLWWSVETSPARLPSSTVLQRVRRRARYQNLASITSAAYPRARLRTRRASSQRSHQHPCHRGWYQRLLRQLTPAACPLPRQSSPRPPCTQAVR